MLSILERWIETAGTAHSALAFGLKGILHPAFSFERSRPGTGREFVLRRGLISEEELIAVQALWPRLATLLKQIPLASFEPILREVQLWSQPAVIAHASVEERIELMMRTAAQRMLLDISKLPQANRALLSRVASIAAWAQLDVQVDLDPIYELLHGSRQFHPDFQTEEAETTRQIRELAASFSQQPPEVTVKQCVEMERDANELGGAPNSRQWHLHSKIAQAVSDPFPWIDAIIEAQALCSFLEPYVYRAVETRPRFDLLLPRLFAVPEYRRLAAKVVLGMTQPEDAILESAMAALPMVENLDSLLLGRRRIPLPTMFRLLNHPDHAVRSLAAITEWLASPEGEVRSELLAEWRKAVVGAHFNNSYDLGRILAKDPSLAYDWCAAHLPQDDWMDIRPASAAVKVLSPQQRLELLLKLTGSAYDDEWFDCLLGGDLDLYAQWLQTAEEHVKLQPLDRPIGERWRRMARIALDAGSTPEEIAKHVRPKLLSIWGSRSEFYRKLIPTFEALCADPDERLHAAGRAGLHWARSTAEQEELSEKQEAVYGL